MIFLLRLVQAITVADTTTAGTIMITAATGTTDTVFDYGSSLSRCKPDCERDAETGVR